jgi:hypothetical protein
MRRYFLKMRRALRNTLCLVYCAALRLHCARWLASIPASGRIARLEWTKTGQTKAMKAQMLKWRIAIAWGVLFSINALCGSFMTVCSGVTPERFLKLQPWMIGAAVLGMWTNTIMAFLSKAQKAIPIDGDAPPLPLPDSDTTFVTKTTVTQQQTKTTQP